MKAVILIHGFITSPKDFNPLYGFLNKNYDLVYKVYLPGHKDNEPYKNFKVDATFNTILDAYDNIAQNYSNIDVIGFSLGGALASYLASVRKIDKLVLLSPANKFLRIGFYHKYRKNIHSLKVRYKILKKKKDLRANTYKIKFNDLKINNKRSIKMALFDLFPHYTIKNLLVFSHIIRRVNKNLLQIDSKTLICWGELDQLVPIRSIEFLRKYINNLKINIYPYLSHLMLSSCNIKPLVSDITNFLGEE